MTGKLQSVLERYEKLNELIADPNVLADMNSYRKYMKEISDITETVDKYKEFLKLKQEREDAEASLSLEQDADMRELLNAEIKELIKKIADVNAELKLLLIPKDENDDKSVIVEIRAGAGGEEAALFAYELYRMYVSFADKHRYKTEEIDSNFTELGGVKEVTFSVVGNGVYGKLKYESGVHRVQRVPETESQGRIQTSTATVAVLPEVEDVEIKIDEKDLKIDTYRSSGAGGQHVNKTSSAVRLTHIPTGIVVACQNERSQFQNKDMCMKMLKAKLAQIKEREHLEKIEDIKGVQKEIAWGSQIRSYVFMPYTLVKDHRTGFEDGRVDNVMDGEIQGFLNAYLKALSKNEFLK